MANVSAVSLKNGNIIQYKNNIWKIIDIQHVKPGKGGAFMQTVLKGVRTGQKTEQRFRSEEAVDKMHFESVAATYLYSNQNSIEVMDSITFEQIEIPKEIIKDKVIFLEDNMEINISKIEDEIIDIELPEKVTLKVVSTQPKMKGQTVTSTNKPAELSNGLTVQVPQFIVEGDEIVVKTEDGTYVEKA